MYVWLKALHIIFMVTWFAGLFYLPRLFMYHAMEENRSSFELFKAMEKRLFGIMTIGFMLTLIFGVGLLVMRWDYLSTTLWFPLKALLLIALIIYHFWCFKLMKQLRQGTNTHSSNWYRWFNEAPAIALIAIVILAILKPF